MSVAFARAQDGAHRLLRHLREVLGGASLSSQSKLDMIVKSIASDMEADVCTLYLRRGTSWLQKGATYSLSLFTFEKKQTKALEELVQDVAENSRPLVLSDIQAHPKYSSKEKPNLYDFHAFAGIPLTRAGSTMGVLVLQNFAKRLYSNEEVETLQTVSMILSEALVAEGLINPGEILTSSGEQILSLRLKGLTIHPGLAKGQAVLHHPHLPIKNLISDNTEWEMRRLYDAVSKMNLSLDSLFSKGPQILTQESQQVFEAYQMAAQDETWLQKIRQAIKTGLTAEAAVQQTQKEFRQLTFESKDPYLKEHFWDFEDLSHRLLHHLLGVPQHMSVVPEEGIILVAKSLGPAELLDYEKYHLKGLILEEGLHMAHVSIVARALQIPVISRLQGVLNRVEFGDILLMDGNTGEVIIRPHEEAVQAFDEKYTLWSQRQEKLKAVHGLPSETLDHVHVGLYLNAGSVTDLKRSEGMALEGVGLYRTEILFMAQDAYPDTQTQENFYREVLNQAGGQPVFFRTLDIGGDKMLPYFRAFPDENPVLGWRAIRIGLDRPMLLRQQLRALIRATRGQDLYVMFPMISHIKEYLEARALLNLELEKEKIQGQDLPKTVKVGMMFEVPALMWQLKEIFAYTDFISVGSNDLLQFFYATDRTNPLLEGRYDSLSPPFLNFLKRLLKEAHKAQCPINICGEMAGSPLEALTLLGLGFRSLSMSPSALGEVKMMIRKVHLKKFSRYLNQLLKSSHKSLRAPLRAYAQDHGILS